MIKRNFFAFTFLLILLLPYCISGPINIKVSPLKTELNLKINEEQTCTIFYVLPDKNIQITSRWSQNNPGEEDKYNLSSEQIGLNINYTRLEYGKYKFCFESQRPGIFYGLIFFQSEDSLIRMGAWVDLNVEGESVIEKISTITGNVVKEVSSSNLDLLIIFTLLLVILGLLVFKPKRSTVPK